MTLNDQDYGPSPAALLTYQQLAAWLNDNVRHLRHLVNQKRIPYVKVGHFVRFDEREILEWLDNNRHGGWAASRQNRDVRRTVTRSRDLRI
jgi:excisionase family DNA binding protein